MGMLSTGLLDQMRDRQELSFDQFVTVQRNTSVTDTQGGESWSWANLSTGIPCRVAPSGLSPVEITVGGQLIPLFVMVFTLPHDVDITAADRLIWPETGGSTYFLISDPDYGYKTAVRVRATKIV